MTRIPASLTFVLVFALYGCGNKGPLVHPPPPEEVPTPAASDAGAEADPLPAGETDTPALPTVPAPAEPAPATPPDDTTDDDPPGG